MQVSSVADAFSQAPSKNVQDSQKAQASGDFANKMTMAMAMATMQPRESSRENANIRSNSTYVMDTSQGDTKIDLEDYLTPKPASGPVNLMDIPLLLPTAHNIDTLSNFSQEQFKGLMQQYNISTPPATIEFDGEGKLVMPKDYLYAKELKQAFDENPGVANALRTTAALASHYAGIMEGQPFREEMSTARSHADQERIVQKYSYLFDDNRPATQIVLSFLENGSMLLGEKNA